MKEEAESGYMRRALPPACPIHHDSEQSVVILALKAPAFGNPIGKFCQLPMCEKSHLHTITHTIFFKIHKKIELYAPAIAFPRECK
jgi:hypothetical protein